MVFRGASRVAVLSLLACLLGACAAPVEEDGEEGSAAISAPSASKAPSFNDALQAAYVAASPDDFAEIPRGATLSGAAKSDFDDAFANCLPQGFTIKAFSWAVQMQTSPTNKKLKMRSFDTIKVTDDDTEKATVVGIYDEDGTLLGGRALSKGIDLPQSSASTIRWLYRKCKSAS